MQAYYLILTDEDGATETVEFFEESNDAAIVYARSIVQEEAEHWCSDGDWGDDGASVGVSWSLSADEEGDIELASGHLTVDIEPDHVSLIRSAVRDWERPDNFCGEDPDHHDWTSGGEGGCDTNPGVWSTGGTSMTFASHCRRCGLHRTEYRIGSQRNPGEHDRVEYEMLDEETIEHMIAHGHMVGDD